MVNIRISRKGRAAAGVAATILCVAAAAWSITALSAGDDPPSPCPAVVVHWQPQPVLEAKFTEKIALDNQAILNGLTAFGKNPRMTVDDIMKYVGGTYLRSPRFWTDHGWVEGWADILPELRGILRSDSRPVVTSVTVLIEYQPYTGAESASSDIDAAAKVRVTFSASPGGYVLEGQLLHRRICVVI